MLQKNKKAEILISAFFCKESKKNADGASGEVIQKIKTLLREASPSKNSKLLDAKLGVFLDNHYDNVIILLD